MIAGLILITLALLGIGASLGLWMGYGKAFWSSSSNSMYDPSAGENSLQAQVTALKKAVEKMGPSSGEIGRDMICQ